MSEESKQWSKLLQAIAKCLVIPIVGRDAEGHLPVPDPFRKLAAVRAASFSSDGSRIVTACSDNSVQVWDAITGYKVSAPIVHDAPVSGQL